MKNEANKNIEKINEIREGLILEGYMRFLTEIEIAIQQAKCEMLIAMAKGEADKIYNEE